jgi:hypothetical protein
MVYTYSCSCSVNVPSSQGITADAPANEQSLINAARCSRGGLISECVELNMQRSNSMRS